MKVCKKNKEIVLEAIRQGNIDAVVVGLDNLIDQIILKMHHHGLLRLLEQAFAEKREDNLSIPLPLFLALSAAAKMKLKTSVSDIPYAITDIQALSELGYNLVDLKNGLEEGLMSEGMVRHLVNKYQEPSIPEDPYNHSFIGSYNQYVQDHVLPSRNMCPNIHILDCTKLKTNLKNENYELSEVVKDQDGVSRGYKMGNIRGITGDIGILEEVILGSIKTHDLELCRDMLLKTPVLHPGDILINDRGFLDRQMMNTLKIERGVDTYVPVRKNMDIYVMAVSCAIEQNQWQPHPNKKRKTQSITLVQDLGPFWQSEEVGRDQEVPLNACVVRDQGTKNEETEYYVFVTTDLVQTAKSIIKTYELRPEIEEDYRQIKEFWKLEDFKSTKYGFVVFHIITVLLGYLFFQIFKTLDGNEKYHKKSLPVLVKQYVPKNKKPTVAVYAGSYFGIFSLLELMDLYVSVGDKVRAKLRPALT